VVVRVIRVVAMRLLGFYCDNSASDHFDTQWFQLITAHAHQHEMKLLHVCNSHHVTEVCVCVCVCVCPQIWTAAFITWLCSSQ